MELPEKRPVPPSQDDFAKSVMDGLRRAGVTNEISYDPEQFQISVEGEKNSVLFLNNGYHEYCFVVEEDRPHVLRRYVRGWMPTNCCPRNLPTYSRISFRQFGLAVTLSWFGWRLRCRKDIGWRSFGIVYQVEGKHKSLVPLANSIRWW